MLLNKCFYENQHIDFVFEPQNIDALPASSKYTYLEGHIVISVNSSLYD